MMVTKLSLMSGFHTDDSRLFSASHHTIGILKYIILQEGQERE